MAQFTDEVPRSGDADADLDAVLSRVKAQNAVGTVLVNHSIQPDIVKLTFDNGL